MALINKFVFLRKRERHSFCNEKVENDENTLVTAKKYFEVVIAGGGTQ